MNTYKRYITLFSADGIPTYTRYMLLQAETPAHAERLVKQVKPDANILFHHLGSSVTNAFEQYYKTLALSNSGTHAHHSSAH